MSVKNVTLNDLGNVLSTPFMTSNSKDLIKAGWKGDIENFSKKLWKYSWARTRDYTMAIIMLTVVVAARKAKDVMVMAKERDDKGTKKGNDIEISLADYINQKVSRNKIKELFDKIVSIESSSDSNNIAQSISKKNKPLGGWFAKCFISLLLASNNDPERAKTVFENFIKQVKKMTKWKINQSYMKELTEVISNALNIHLTVPLPERQEIDDSAWEGRYADMSETKDLNYKDYRKFYVSQASDGRDLHGILRFDEQSKDDDTRKLNKKFINSVMERRYAHLQQVKHVIKFFMDKTGDVAFVNEVLDKRISKLEKSLTKDGREEAFKEYRKRYDGITEEKARTLFDVFYPIGEIPKRIEKFKQIKEAEDFTKDRTALLELYDLIDKLLSALQRNPEKIPNLKLSGTSADRINKAFRDTFANGTRGVKYILEVGKCYKPFMVTSDEPSDRILAELENFAFDGDNGHNDIERLCALITSIPETFAYMGEFHMGKLPASKSLPNPYRGLFGGVR